MVSGGWVTSSITEVFDFSTGSWTMEAQTPYPHKVGLSLQYKEGKILYVGGDGPAGQTDAILEYQRGTSGSGTASWTMRSETMSDPTKDAAGILVPNGLISCPV